MRTRIKNGRGFTIGELVVVMAIMLAGAVIMHPFVLWVHDRAEYGRCSDNMRQIGEALYVYAKEHKGSFPDSLDELYKEEYIADTGLLNCPTARKEGPADAAGYAYTPGMTVNGPANAVLLRDKKGNHAGGGRIVLYVDGTVRRERE